MITFNQLWIVSKHFFQLHFRHIQITVSAIFQTLIIFFNACINHIKAIGIFLQLVNICACQIALRHHIFADYPFA